MDQGADWVYLSANLQIQVENVTIVLAVQQDTLPLQCTSTREKK